LKLDARSAAALFAPRKLTQARQMLAITRAELARRAEVSAASISQYESGAMRPRPATLAQLSLVLNVPLEFLTESRIDTPLPTVDTSFFRSLRRTTQRDRERATAYAGLLAQLVAEIECRVTLPPFTPVLDLALDPDDDPDAAEEAAVRIRTRWEIGTEPLAHAVRLIERHGVIVARLPLSSSDVDAFSWANGPRPLVLLGDDKRDFERSRFDVCHELAHILLHAADPEPAHPRMERQAHRFAGALLIPAEALRDAWPRGRWDWNQMVRIKERWGISIGAQLLRARDLGVLTADSYLSKMKYMSRMDWRRREPGPHRPPEKPDLLNQAIGLLEQSGTALDTIAEEGNLLGRDVLLERLCLTPRQPLRVDG
jgi:Zn-dependent peptidase ImmA (M78 family)/transcriptional regulator with XRE-family HTH domain